MQRDTLVQLQQHMEPRELQPSPHGQAGAPAVADSLCKQGTVCLHTNEHECPICCELLLDPVAAPCGHDFCKACLEQWKRTSCAGANKAMQCPLCRKDIPEDFGVCMRLKALLEKAFPAETALRRRERQTKANEVDKRVRELHELARCPAVQQQMSLQAAVRLQQPSWPSPLSPEPQASAPSSWDQDAGLPLDGFFAAGMYSPAMSTYSTQSTVTTFTPARSQPLGLFYPHMHDIGSSSASQHLSLMEQPYATPYPTPPRSVPLYQFTAVPQFGSAAAAASLPPLPPRRQLSSPGCSLAAPHGAAAGGASDQRQAFADGMPHAQAHSPGLLINAGTAASTPRVQPAAADMLLRPACSHPMHGQEFMPSDDDDSWPLLNVYPRVVSQLHLAGDNDDIEEQQDANTPRYVAQHGQHNSQECDTPRVGVASSSRGFFIPSLPPSVADAALHPVMQMQLKRTREEDEATRPVVGVRTNAQRRLLFTPRATQQDAVPVSDQQQQDAALLSFPNLLGMPPLACPSPCRDSPLIRSQTSDQVGVGSSSLTAGVPVACGGAGLDGMRASSRCISSDWLHRLDSNGSSSNALLQSAMSGGGNLSCMPSSSNSMVAPGSALGSTTSMVQMPCMHPPSQPHSPATWAGHHSSELPAATEGTAVEDCGLPGLPDVCTLSLYSVPRPRRPPSDVSEACGPGLSPIRAPRPQQQGGSSSMLTSGAASPLHGVVASPAMTPHAADSLSTLFFGEESPVYDRPTASPLQHAPDSPLLPGSLFNTGEFSMPAPPPPRAPPQRSPLARPPSSMPSILQLASPLRTVRHTALSSTLPMSPSPHRTLSQPLHSGPPDTPRADQRMHQSPFTPHSTVTHTTPARAFSMPGSELLLQPLSFGLQPAGAAGMLRMMSPQGLQQEVQMMAAAATAANAHSTPGAPDAAVVAQLQQLVERRTNGSRSTPAQPPLPSQPWHNREQDHTLRMSCTSALLPVFEKRYEELVAQGNPAHPRGAVFLYIAAIEEYLYHTTPSREEYGNLCTLHARMVQAVDALISVPASSTAVQQQSEDQEDEE